jgi:hypothetical protein
VQPLSIVAKAPPWLCSSILSLMLVPWLGSTMIQLAVAPQYLSLALDPWLCSKRPQRDPAELAAATKKVRFCRIPLLCNHCPTPEARQRFLSELTGQLWHVSYVKYLLLALVSWLCSKRPQRDPAELPAATNVGGNKEAGSLYYAITVRHL